MHVIDWELLNEKMEKSLLQGDLDLLAVRIQANNRCLA